jgi:hypothetical protein
VSLHGLLFSDDLEMHDTATEVALRLINAFCNVRYWKGTQALRARDGDSPLIVLNPDCSLVRFTRFRTGRKFMQQIYNLLEQLLGVVPPLGKKASASTLSGTDTPENSPEITMTGIVGNRRRTTERNSNPFMFGICRSEIIMSGSDCLSAAKPSNPSSAPRTS